MTDRDARIKVCLFAKAPQLGRVKTRMFPHLSESECLQLHWDLLMQVAANAARLPLQDYVVELHITARHADFDALTARYGFAQQLQVGSDLGARMSHAVSESLHSNDVVLLLGADCPFVNSDLIQTMSQALRHSEAALVPATDGGYVALMLRAHDASLFSKITWGSDNVAATTISRLQALNWPYSLLGECPDIDRPEDLAQLALLPALAQWAYR